MPARQRSSSSPGPLERPSSDSSRCLPLPLSSARLCCRQNTRKFCLINYCALSAFVRMPLKCHVVLCALAKGRTLRERKREGETERSRVKDSGLEKIWIRAIYRCPDSWDTIIDTLEPNLNIYLFTFIYLFIVWTLFYSRRIPHVKWWIPRGTEVSLHLRNWLVGHVPVDLPCNSLPPPVKNATWSGRGWQGECVKRLFEWNSGSWLWPWEGNSHSFDYTCVRWTLNVCPCIDFPAPPAWLISPGRIHLLVLVPLKQQLKMKGTSECVCVCVCVCVCACVCVCVCVCVCARRQLPVCHRLDRIMWLHTEKGGDSPKSCLRW